MHYRREQLNGGLWRTSHRYVNKEHATDTGDKAFTENTKSIIEGRKDAGQNNTVTEGVTRLMQKMHASDPSTRLAHWILSLAPEEIGNLGR